jgi:V8-like Glu-specific endopeptidase
MSDHARRSFKERALPLAVVALTLGAIVGFSQLSANLNSGASAKQAPTRAAAPAVAPGDTVVVNHNLAATKQYWTAAKMRNAQELIPTRTDAAGESYGTANLDFTRSRITPQSANRAAPYKMTGKLFFSTTGGSNFVCSGSVIAMRIVLTAAHCIHPGTGSFYTNWTFVPGYDGTQPTLALQRPYGTWSWTSAQVPTNWLSTGGSLPNPTDFGVIVVADQSFNGGPLLKIAQKAGKYSFSLGHLFDNHVTMLGYPCNFDSCAIMQRVDSSDHRVPPGYSGGNAYEYGSDMTGGSSGGPWLENFGTGAVPQGGWTTRNSVVAVTSYIYTDGGMSLIEGASQLDSRFNTIYMSRCAAQAGNC